MRVILFTGSYPPQKCGVGDYAYGLNSAKQKNDWVLFNKQNWSIWNFLRYLRELNGISGNILCIQYPTNGLMRSLIPHLVALYYKFGTRMKVALVLHEHSQLSKLNRIAIRLLIYSATYLIFTTHNEYLYTSKRYNTTKKKLKVIPIISNIPRSDNSLRITSERAYDLVFFGQIRPNRGLEEFLTLISLLKANHDSIKVIITGQTLKHFNSYSKRIIEVAGQLGISLILNSSLSDVSETLSNSKFAYLHYPDGASERRGSLLACLQNGVIVLTNYYGMPRTPLFEAIIQSNDIQTAVVNFNELRDMSIEKLKSLQMTGSNYCKKNIPASWDSLVQEYDKFFTE